MFLFFFFFFPSEEATHPAVRSLKEKEKPTEEFVCATQVQYPTKHKTKSVCRV